MKSLTFSAIAETVGIAAVLGLRRTWQLRASAARAAFSSCCSPREASRSQAMQPEAHGVVQHMVDGLWATSLIKCQHPVAKWWSDDLAIPLTWTADEPMRKAMQRQQTA